MDSEVWRDQKNDIWHEMRSNWVPSQYQQKIASAVIKADPGRKVIVGLAMPGKQKGIWTLGQEVLQVPGFWVARTDDEYRVARTWATITSESFLALRQGGHGLGTVAYVVIRVNDSGFNVAHDVLWEVFEW